MILQKGNVFFIAGCIFPEAYLALNPVIFKVSITYFMADLVQRMRVTDTGCA